MKALTRTAIVCLSMLLQGCSLAINAEDIEPTDLSALAVGTSREDVEKVLSAPTTQEPEPGETIAIYAYNKGADLSVYSQVQLNKVARQLNERPRKMLGFETPAERFNACVASTG